MVSNEDSNSQRGFLCIHSFATWTGIGSDDLPLGINTDQLKLFPASIHNVLHTKIELATHDHSVGFTCKLIHVVETDDIDLVVDVETIHRSAAFFKPGSTVIPSDVGTVVLHDHIDEVINSN